MLQLIDQILDQLPDDVMTDTELFTLLGRNTPASRYNLVKRALAKGELIRIRRGLYHLAKRYQRRGVNPYELAQRIYGPSYISFESALSYHGLIPEAVYGIHSAAAKRSREFETPQGVFIYTQIPTRAFQEGVERVTEAGRVFLMATPLKALADHVYVNRLGWTGTAPLTKSLRIETEALKFDSREMGALMAAYGHPQVSHFLAGLKKELGL